MNCDQVFDVLTRGPFPTGATSDQHVETHLLVCADCRQLAEALRPALELFEEAVTLEESRTLPGYWGSLHTGSEGQVALAQSMHAPRHFSRRLLSVAAERATEVDWWRITAAVLLGVLLGSWFRSGPATGDRLVVGSANRKPAANLSLLASMSLPSACLKRDATPRIETAELGWERRVEDRSAERERLSVHTSQNSSRGAMQREVLSSDFACCTTCHKAGVQLVSHRATARISQSCQACHE